ncbi:MAG: stage II sporulation protein M [Planctomycetota bacterium]
MNVAKLLEKRRTQWTELESLCDAMEASGRTDKAAGEHHQGAEGVSRFATLYRAACADLALADAYQMPPGTVTYLHRLVARAHNQLYRANRFEPSRWTDVVFYEAPQQIFRDPCVRWATVIFFGLFALSLFIARNDQLFPGFAERIVGTDQLDGMEEMYERPLAGSLDHYVQMSGYYIQHNTSIGLRCFIYGILIIPCLYTLAFNAIYLGTVFGYMSRPDAIGGDNFFHFVTAHGPFELTAIALAAGAGLRLGVGLFSTGGLSRIDSLRTNALKAVPVMAASAMLFVCAAFTEGFLSPSPAPYIIKALWAIVSSGLLSFYFVVLGFPRDETLFRRIDVGGESYDAT